MKTDGNFDVATKTSLEVQSKVQLEPADSTSVISNSPLFWAQNHFPWTCPSDGHSLHGHSLHFELFFVSLVSDKQRASTIFQLKLNWKLSLSVNVLLSEYWGAGKWEWLSKTTSGDAGRWTSGTSHFFDIVMKFHVRNKKRYLLVKLPSSSL